MAIRIETADNFTARLLEVDLLLEEADKCAPGGMRENEHLAAALNKAALLLLTGKFESFLESTAEEFLFALNQAGAHARHIPERLLVEHSVKAVKEAKERLARGDIANLRNVFLALGRHWGELEPCSNLSVCCKFSYGKHGEKEIMRLFRRLGIDNVFTVVKVTILQETYEGQSPSEIDIKGMVNSLINIRNNILHQDSSPTLTTITLRQQSAWLRLFAHELVKVLQSIADGVESDRQSVGATDAS